MVTSKRRSLGRTCLILIFLIVFFAGPAKGGVAKPYKGLSFHIRYATHFRIEYLENGCKLVTDGIGRKLLLTPRGQIPPEGYKQDQVIEIPVRKVVAKWTTIPPLLKVLGVIDSIVGVTIREKEWHIDEIKKGMEKGRIRYLGGSRETDYERLRDINPDVFFAGEWEKQEKLNELGIPFAVVTEYLERNPLARLEWIKFFAAFYNREHEAENFFKKAVKNVKRLSKKLEGLKNRPRILWGFITERETVYMPRVDTYVARMISMAGGHYVFAGPMQTGSAEITLEEFYSWGKDADIYISPGTLPQYGITSIKKLVAIHPILSDFRSIKRGNVWCFQPWYWESIDKTDDIIEDLAAIFHPGLFPGHRYRYFLKLPER